MAAPAVPVAPPVRARPPRRAEPSVLVSWGPCLLECPCPPDPRRIMRTIRELASGFAPERLSAVTWSYRPPEEPPS